MTTVILTRHGHVDWLAPERSRSSGPAAHRQGQRQAVADGGRHPIGVAGTRQPSTPARWAAASDPGAAIAAALGARAEALAGLNDIACGAWQGLTRPLARRGRDVVPGAPLNYVY